MNYLTNKKLKIFAMYLPQYHVIPENSEFWGENYTDWEAVRNNRPLFEGHRQPKIPLNNNYYDLSKKESIVWQAKLAKEYGIDGFGIYHYWFNSNQNLLNTPSEIILQNKDIDIDFFFSWDNASWKRTWSNVKIGNDWAPLYENRSNDKKEILAELKYGEEKDWEIHFDYLLQFFKDERYLKIDNKPVFSILNQDNDTKILENMCSYWNKLAIGCGFNGIAFLGKKKNNNINFTEYSFTYEPEWSGWTWRTAPERIKLKLYKIIQNNKVRTFKYDKIWKSILNNAKNCSNSKQFFSGFVSYDDTPRRGENGKYVIGSTPEKFKTYLSKLCEISVAQNKDIVFLIAWNEWGEGAYLEPDTDNKYGYLKAVLACKKKFEDYNEVKDK